MDKKALLRQRGHESIRKILTESGGVYSSSEVAELLGISLDEVSALVEQRGMLAIELDDEYQFPTWQIDENGIVPKFAEIMAMLDTASPIGAVRFFQTFDRYLGETPIQTLRKNSENQLELIKQLAKQFNQQTAR